MRAIAGSRRRLRVAILDLVSKRPSRKLYARVMKPNLASIMPQVVAVWCQQLGHDVRFVCYTGFEDLSQELADDADILVIGAFTSAAQTAYAISNLYRRRGAITVLGGPHARCYPEDAARYFDYVLGFTDKTTVEDVLRDCAPHRPLGVLLGARRQPLDLPGVQERWQFIEPTIAKAPTFKLVPMIGSMGCPYTCSFCIDSVVDYQPLAFEQIREDLRFLLGKMRRPRVAWHDPNFGVRFDDYLTTIEEAVPAGSIDFIAESSLSLLSEPNLRRLRKNGFKGMLPGIESWYSLGNKSKTGRNIGADKVKQVSEHVNLILEYIPYVQANFVLGLDFDQGPEPFELTKQFVDRSPGAFPGFSLLSAFGRAAPLNLELQREDRVLPFPFHFLDNNKAMNVRPKRYDWPEFYDHLIDLTRYAFSWPRIYRRMRANQTAIPKWLNVVRAVSSEGFGRLKYHSRIRRLLDTDRTVRQFFEGEAKILPKFYEAKIRQDLGPLWDLLPPAALCHDHLAYLKSQQARPAQAPARSAARRANGLTPPDLRARLDDQAGLLVVRE
ncbi:MAG: Elongator protein 3/MiaB/NifB [Rhodospirillales bacterium]|nr:Elongator protein 3/MiaB/NifB [Rhodospirillales bacterium]